VHRARSRQLIDDERFKDNVTRVLHRDALTRELETALVMESTAHWLAQFAAVGVPATEVRNIVKSSMGHRPTRLELFRRSHFRGPERIACSARRCASITSLWAPPMRHPSSVATRWSC